MSTDVGWSHCGTTIKVVCMAVYLRIVLGKP